MRSLIVRNIAIILIFGGSFLALSNDIFAEVLNKCCSTFGACCECNGPCSAGLFSCSCDSPQSGN